MKILFIVSILLMIFSTLLLRVFKKNNENLKKLTIIKMCVSGSFVLLLISGVFILEKINS
jgi:uncharacterized membrane protein